MQRTVEGLKKLKFTVCSRNTKFSSSIFLTQEQKRGSNKVKTIFTNMWIFLNKLKLATYQGPNNFPGQVVKEC